MRADEDSELSSLGNKVAKCEGFTYNLLIYPQFPPIEWATHKSPGPITMSHQEAEHPSYQIHTGQVKDAIETLERGRGLLWSEMRGFRTSIDHLSTVDPSLAETFAGVNRDLESLTTSDPQGLMVDNCEVKGDERTGEFGRIAKKQRELLDKRNILISEIRSLPGFEDFLTSPLFRHPQYCCCMWIGYRHQPFRVAFRHHHSPPRLTSISYHHK
jgi:hypothetical protein